MSFSLIYPQVLLQLYEFLLNTFKHIRCSINFLFLEKSPWLQLERVLMPATQLSSWTLFSPLCWVFPSPLLCVRACFLNPMSLFSLDYFLILVSASFSCLVGKSVHRKENFWDLESLKISLSYLPIFDSLSIEFLVGNYLPLRFSEYYSIVF